MCACRAALAAPLLFASTVTFSAGCDAVGGVADDVSPPGARTLGMRSNPPGAGRAAEGAWRWLAAGPLLFERNLGQADRRVEFLAQGLGFTVFLARNEIAVALDPAQSSDVTGSDWGAVATVVRMRWLGAERLPRIVGEDRLASRSDYVKGSDPSRWLSDVPHFGSIRYRRVYPGIDLVVHGRGRAPQYDFVVAPGADAERIALAFSGQERVHVNEVGDLVLATGAGEIVHQAPVAFQVDAGGRRQHVAARFVVRDDRSVGFSLAEFDRARELVIDPTIHYATLLGDWREESGFGVAEDGAGRVYVVGRTTSVSPGEAPNSDVFVTKIGLSGGAAPHVIFRKVFGGDGDEAATAVAVYRQEAHIVGAVYSTDFPLTVNASHLLMRNSNGVRRSATASDAFYVRLNASGNIRTSTLIGGTGGDVARDVAVTEGLAYIAGSTASTNFPRHATAGVPGGDEAGIDGFCPSIAFLTKLRLGTTGAIESVVYSTYLPGAHPGDVLTRQSKSVAIGVDGFGNAHVVGLLRSTRPLGPGAAPPAGGLCSDITFQAPSPILWKVGPAGTLEYAARFGGSLVAPYDIAVAPDGHAWVVGSVASTSPQIITVKPLQPRNAGGLDAFITKFGPKGAFLFSTYFGGRSDDRATGVALHRSGAVTITGTTISNDFPRKNEVTDNGTIFVVGLDPQAQLVFSTKYGGHHRGDTGPAIAVDDAGRAIVVGSTNRSGFHVTANALQSSLSGGQDAFLFILNPDKRLAPQRPTPSRRR